VLEEVKQRKRFTYMMLSQHAQVVDVADGALVLGFASSGARDNFGSGGSAEVLVESLVAVIGVELRVRAVLAEEAAPSVASAAPPPRQQPAPRPADPPQPRNASRQPGPPPPPEQESGMYEVSHDDEELDAAHNAEELLTRAFGAEVISVQELGRTE